MKQTTNVPGYITDQSVLSLRQTPDGPHKSATNPCAIAVHLKAISTHFGANRKSGFQKSHASDGQERLKSTLYQEMDG